MFNLRLARYRKHVVALHGDPGAAWRMQSPYVPGTTSPLVNAQPGGFHHEKGPLSGGTTELDFEKTPADNDQRYMDDQERSQAINEKDKGEVSPPGKTQYKVKLRDGYQMTPELAEEVKNWETDGSSMYVMVDSPEKVDQIRQRLRVPGVIVEERTERRK